MLRPEGFRCGADLLLFEEKPFGSAEQLLIGVFMDEKKAIDVDEIMREIRTQIVAEHQNRAGNDGFGLNVSGTRYSPQFYESLYQAWLLQKEMHVDLLVTRTDIPLIGPLIDRVRESLHKLVLFYIQGVVEQQKKINQHMIVAISEMSEETLRHGDGE